MKSLRDEIKQLKEKKSMIEVIESLNGHYMYNIVTRET